MSNPMQTLPDPNQQQQNPPTDPSPSNQLQTSNTPTEVYDPRVGSLQNQIAELQRVNNAILEKLNAPAPIPQPAAPQFSETDWQEKPAEVIGRLVEHGVTKAVDRLKGDINSQLSPVNNFIAETQRNNTANQLVTVLKSNPYFSKIGEPAVESAFRQGLSNWRGDLDQQAVMNLYVWAVGAVATNTVTPQNNNNNQNIPANQNPPAHLRPDPRPNNPNQQTVLPPLDQNENTIARQNGWSHARAAYAYKKISWEQYHALEPTGKQIEGI